MSSGRQGGRFHGVDGWVLSEHSKFSPALMLLTNSHLIIAAPDTEHLERNIKNILLKTTCGVYSHTLNLYFLLPSSLLQSSEVTRGGKDENQHDKATDSSCGPQGLDRETTGTSLTGGNSPSRDNNNDNPNNNTLYL